MAQAHLRSIMVILDAIVLAQPEIYLTGKEGLIHENGKVTNSETKKYLINFLNRFHDLISK